MSKKTYFQNPKNGTLLTEYEVKTRKLDRASMKKRFLAKHELVECEGYGKIAGEYQSVGYANPYYDIGSRDMLRKSTRKQLMQLGYVW